MVLSHFCVLLLLPAGIRAFAQDEVLPEVFLSGKVALTDRIPLHFTGIVNADCTISTAVDTLRWILVRDLTLSGFFDLRLPNIPPDTARSKSRVTITYLDGVYHSGETSRTDIHLRSAFRAEPFWAKSYEFPTLKTRAAAHRIAADLIRQMTGETSVLQTRIAFTGQTGTGKEIFSTTFDGFDLVQHTHQKSSALSPTWSPDGNKIAYTSFLNGQADIFILDVASGKYSVFQDAPGVDSAPDWAPDGNSLAFSSSQDGNAEIYVRGVDGRIDRRLTYSWAIETAPSWSPTGRELAFTSDRLGKPQIFIMDENGADQRRLTMYGDYNDSPAWSPRGEMIAYVRRDNDGFQIYLTDPRGEKHVKLTNGPGRNMDPCWSPDGLRIAFTSDRSGMNQIYTMDLYGRGVERVTYLPMPCSNPTWSPVLEDSDEIIITAKK